MSAPYLEYQHKNGYIHHWLVAGPQAIEVPDLDRFQGADYKLQIARHYYDPQPGVPAAPREREKFKVGEAELRWDYQRTRDDHFIDLTAFYHTCHYLRAWAYAQVVCPGALTTEVELTTNAPADVWINGEHVGRIEHFHHQIPRSQRFAAVLNEGSNEVLVRFEAVAARECPYAMALKIAGLPEQATVRLPAVNELTARRQVLERVFDEAYVAKRVFAHDDAVEVRWPDDMKVAGNLTIRAQKPTGQIYVEAKADARAGNATRMGRAYQLPDSPFVALLMPHPEEYYMQNVRVTRRIPFWSMRNRFSEAPYGDYMARRIEALDDATRREGIYAEIAKMALGRWKQLKPEVFHKTIDGINRREDCSDFYMVGLLGAMHRYFADPNFPEELKQPLEQCVLNFKYWMDEPGSDAMCYWSENHQILFHACAVLAGQLYPDRTFSNSGQHGRWHREKGERMALSWLRKRAAGGFREWDSNCYFEHDVLALAHLVDLADDDQLHEMAAVVLDKLFFTMAVNSFKGVFGSTHGRTYTPMITSGRLELTSGVGRLLWGMGVFNAHILGTVALACAESYELPPIIAQIAADQPEELWSRERHAGELEEWCDLASGAWEVNKVTYKTPDYMLCSAQDHQPGTPGIQQHIWQATFGPDAIVFVNHPPCFSEEGSHRPNFWHGNVVLPRVGQWKDALVAVHNLPDDDWLGFTHAFFPTYAFDEYLLRDGWAFARKGAGYIALCAARGLELITRGDSAYSELRSYGRHNVWLCQMGRTARDGSFEEFQQRILASEVSFDQLAVRYRTPRGELIEFGWEGPLLVNDIQQPLSGFRHYDSIYSVTDLGAPQMDIVYGAEALRLHFD